MLDNWSIWEFWSLRYQVHRVQLGQSQSIAMLRITWKTNSKAINAFVQPKPQHTIQFLSDLFTVPVEIRLILAKYMQICQSD